jgi:hypothetical protein
MNKLSKGELLNVLCGIEKQTEKKYSKCLKELEFYKTHEFLCRPVHCGYINCNNFLISNWSCDRCNRTFCDNHKDSIKEYCCWDCYYDSDSDD